MIKTSYPCISAEKFAILLLEKTTPLSMSKQEEIDMLTFCEHWMPHTEIHMHCVRLCSPDTVSERYIIPGRMAISMTPRFSFEVAKITGDFNTAHSAMACSIGKPPLIEYLESGGSISLVTAGQKTHTSFNRKDRDNESMIKRMLDTSPDSSEWIARQLYKLDIPLADFIPHIQGSGVTALLPDILKKDDFSAIQDIDEILAHQKNRLGTGLIHMVLPLIIAGQKWWLEEEPMSTLAKILRDNLLEDLEEFNYLTKSKKNITADELSLSIIEGLYQFPSLGDDFDIHAEVQRIAKEHADLWLHNNAFTATMLLTVISDREPSIRSELMGKAISACLEKTIDKTDDQHFQIIMEVLETTPDAIRPEQYQNILSACSQNIKSAHSFTPIQDQSAFKENMQMMGLAMDGLSGPSVNSRLLVFTKETDFSSNPLKQFINKLKTICPSHDQEIKLALASCLIKKDIHQRLYLNIADIFPEMIPKIDGFPKFTNQSLSNESTKTLREHIRNLTSDSDCGIIFLADEMMTNVSFETRMLGFVRNSEDLLQIQHADVDVFI